MALPSRVLRQEGPPAFLFASQVGKRPTINAVHGFTLVEMAVILVIAGILVALGAAMITPLTTMIKTRETRDTLNTSKEAIVSRAAASNRIPPAATFPNVATSTADPWGQQIAYLYDSFLSPATATKDTICGRSSTSLSVTTVSPAATINNVAFVMISSGGDGLTQTTLNGAAIATGTRAVAAGTVRADNNNSDILTWVTLEELRSRIGCQGAQLKIVNNELPYGSASNTYSATIVADGGVPFSVPPNTYKWCVSTLPTGFSQTGGVANANCLGLAESGWSNTASQSLTISFSAGAVTSGSYQFTVMARDNGDGTASSNACNSATPGDNCAQKTFVITVNP